MATVLPTVDLGDSEAHGGSPSPQVNLQEAILAIKRRKAELAAEQLGVMPASQTEKPETADVDLPPLHGLIIPGLSEGEKLQFAGAFIANQDEMGFAESLQAIRPKTKISADSQKNIIVTFGDDVPELKGQGFLVNPPGFEKTDVAKFFGDMLAFTPAGKFAAKGASTVGRFTKAAIGEGATSIGLDLAAQEFGSKQPINYFAAGLAALTGGTVEIAARPFIGAIRGIISKPAFFRNGQLTEKGKAAAQAAGLDPDALTPALAESFATLRAKGLDPFSAGSVALGREFNTDLTKGQATGNIKTIETEEAIRQGVHGDSAQQVLVGQEKRQQKQLGEARDKGTTGVIEKPVQAGGAIAAGVQREAKRMDDDIQKAYEDAGQEGASFTGDHIRPLLKGIRESIKKNGFIDGNKPRRNSLTPASLSMIAEVRSLSKKVRSASKARGQGQIRMVDFAQIETTRRRMNKIIDTIPPENKTDFNTAVLIKQQLDKFVDDGFDNAMFSGNPDALRLIKKARGLRTEFGKRFEARRGDEEAGRIINKMLTKNPTMEEASNLLIGYGKIGGSAKLVAPKVIDRLNTILGDSSDEMMALKEAVLMRVIPDIKGAVSPVRARTLINKALDEAPTLMNKLFSSEELSRMRNFDALLQRLELPQQAQNASGSGFRLASLLGRVLGAKAGTVVGKTLIAASAGSQIGQSATSRLFGASSFARQATGGLPVPGSGGVTGAGVAGTRAAQEDIEQSLQDF